MNPYRHYRRALPAHATSLAISFLDDEDMGYAWFNGQMVTVHIDAERARRHGIPSIYD